MFLTEEKSRRELEAQLVHDDATGLLNRRGLERALGKPTPTLGAAAVCLLNIDNFERINEQFSCNIGDAVLVEIAFRLKKRFGGSGPIARIGGDEFVLCCEAQGKPALHTAAEQVLHAIPDPMPVDGNQVVVSANLGAVLMARSDAGLDGPLSQARIALQEA